MNRKHFVKIVGLGLMAGAGLASVPAFAQQSINVNIGSSHPVTNIWAFAMKNVFQPEVDRILKAGGKYEVKWRENYGGTLCKFTDTRAGPMPLANDSAPCVTPVWMLV